MTGPDMRRQEEHNTWVDAPLEEPYVPPYNALDGFERWYFGENNFGGLFDSFFSELIPFVMSDCCNALVAWSSAFQGRYVIEFFGDSFPKKRARSSNNSQDSSALRSRSLPPADWSMVLSGAVDMIVKDLDLEPKIDAMMRDFLEISLAEFCGPSWWKELNKESGSVGLDSRTEVRGMSIRFAPTGWCRIEEGLNGPEKVYKLTPHLDQPTSPIHAFPTKDMYSPEYSDSFQHTAHEDSPVKVVAPPPKSKLTRGRIKMRMHPSRLSVEPMTKITSIGHFLTMKLNTESSLHFVIVESINLNVDVGDGEEDEDQSTNDEALARLMVSELAMHNERAIGMKKEERLAILEIKRREVKCRERELAMQEYRKRQEDIRFYMQAYDHLTKDAPTHIEALRAEIKASLIPEWGKLVTDVKLARYLHMLNYDQLYVYLEQHEYTTPQYQQQFLPPTQHMYSLPPQLKPYGAPHHPKQYPATYPTNLSHTQPFVTQNAYPPLTIPQHPQNEFPQLDSGLAVPTFLPGDDQIACMNKAMAFLSDVFTPHYPLTNNKLRYSSNLGNQATVQDGRVTVLQVQGRQGQNIVGLGSQGNTSSSKGNTSGQAKVLKCYNCQGEGHMARQCTQPKRRRNATWFKEKVLLVQAQTEGKELDEEKLEFLADPGVADGQVS
ncbi:integrase, catalytic region, zinc finger, CCHC-type containing protein [Tanacetum coccineum]